MKKYRAEFAHIPYSRAVMIESPDGEWVKWEDVEASINLFAESLECEYQRGLKQGSVSREQKIEAMRKALGKYCSAERTLDAYEEALNEKSK